MKRKRRSVVKEWKQWVDVYTMPDGTKHFVYLQPYKLPTPYQRKLALKRSGIVLPQAPPMYEITYEQRMQTAVKRFADFFEGHTPDPRGMPEQYEQFGKTIVLYWCRQYRIEGPELTARQKFEQRIFDNPNDSYDYFEGES